MFEVGARPRSAAFLPDSSRAYVTAENGGTVHVVDTKKSLGDQDIEDHRRNGAADGRDGVT